VEHLYLYKMTRKKWTPREEELPGLFTHREKRKWQIALRRYVFLHSPCSFYAPYFGLDAPKLREWIETQFTGGMKWDNFSDQWYFGHVLSPAHFDFTKEDDLKCCWNFRNISAIPKAIPENEYSGLAQAKQYFQRLQSAAAGDICTFILKKIELAERAAAKQFESRLLFAEKNADYMKQVFGFDAYQFEQLNNRISPEEIIREKELFKKF
jgi:hypothetical protein